MMKSLSLNPYPLPGVPLRDLLHRGGQQPMIRAQSSTQLQQDSTVLRHTRQGSLAQGQGSMDLGQGSSVVALGVTHQASDTMTLSWAESSQKQMLLPGAGQVQ